MPTTKRSMTEGHEPSEEHKRLKAQLEKLEQEKQTITTKASPAETVTATWGIKERKIYLDAGGKRMQTSYKNLGGKLLYLLCRNYPKPVLVGDVMLLLYPNYKQEIREGVDVMKRVRAVFSDLRKKYLEKAGLDADIVPAVHTRDKEDCVVKLQVLSLKRNDELAILSGGNPQSA